MSVESSISSTMLRTLRGEISLDAALAAEQNMLLKLTYDQKRSALLDYLYDHKCQIEAIVSYHLNLPATSICYIAPESDWIHGSFNICIPIYVNNQNGHSEKRVIIRFPLPYKIGEEAFPGNTDEKLRCEVATYVWIHENCPDVPVPQLLGFAFSGCHCVGYGIVPSVFYCLLLNLRSLLLLGKPRGIFELENIFGGNYALCLAITFFVNIFAGPNRAISHLAT